MEALDRDVRNRLANHRLLDHFTAKQPRDPDECRAAMKGLNRRLNREAEADARLLLARRTSWVYSVPLTGQPAPPCAPRIAVGERDHTAPESHVDAISQMF